MMYLFWLSIVLIAVIHEAGHVWELKRGGGKLSRFGLGIPVPYIPHLSLEVKGISFELHPLLIGAFVEEKHGSTDHFSDKEKLAFFGGGVMINVVSGLLILAVVAAYHGSMVALSILLIVATVIFFGRSIFYYLLPFIGSVFFVFVVISMWNMGGSHILNVDFVESNSRIKEMVNGRYALLFWLLASMSIVIGLFNAIPLGGLDGHHSLTVIIDDWKDGSSKSLPFSIFTLVGFLIVVVASLLPVFTTIWHNI